ncbi:MAG: carbohydrate ABC transporter permease [Chloroflexota bacterium]|nr:carbohydrate ABC transporter permease [Chloroflexota bacterium]
MPDGPSDGIISHHTAGAAVRFLLALLLAVIFLLPIYWALVASLRQPGLPPPQTVEWWPEAARWQNYADIFRLVPMGRYTLNSLAVVAIAVPATLITAALAGFGLSQLPDPARRWLLIASILVMMIPAPAIWMFRFQLLRWTGLLSSLWALIIPAFAASSPLFVLLFFWTFRRNPQELFEAAQLDGANAVQVWWRIALPLARPTLAAVAVLTFVLYWNDFVGPVLYLYRPETYTLPVGLQILKQYDATNWPLLMAGAVFMTLPIVFLFLILQRWFLTDRSLANLLEKG